MLVMIDNYDSFTYNLVHYFNELGQELRVIRNDQLTVEQLSALKPDGLVISPGPATPNEAGISLSAVAHFQNSIPILGVCLGHQVICQHFGASIVQAPEIVHGYTSQIEHQQHDLFEMIPSPFNATRYHSLVADADSLPTCLKATAWQQSMQRNNQQKLVMAVAHESLPIYGIQFHPESVLTEHGHRLLNNFIAKIKAH
jgi:anthranilate synthase/aminodeoxychorismate synthase-like glutamine amidotransferase